MNFPAKIFLFPGNLVADRLGATKTDDRAMIRTLVDMLFWNLVITIAAFLVFR